MKFTSAVLVALCLAIAAHADIREIKSMSEIVPEVTPATLLIFDLDNTIMETVQTLGSDQWFEHRHKAEVQALLDAGTDEATAEKKGRERAIALWSQVQRVTHMQPVEALTPGLIGRFQARGVRVLGLTARPLDLAESTRRQLGSFKVDLSRRPVHAEDIELPSSEEAARFERGILFSGKNSKGEILVRLLEKAGLRPSKVVFVDDKERHTKTVDAAMAKLGIPCVSFRYGAADAKVKAFNAEIARVQLRYFGKILPDSAAEALLK